MKMGSMKMVEEEREKEREREGLEEDRRGVGGEEGLPKTPIPAEQLLTARPLQCL